MQKKELSVLVVDDQPGVRQLLDVIIRDCGHKSILARNGLEAVESVKALMPDLVFMDVCMPLMDGIEALGRIKIISPKTEVALMTAYISDEMVQQAKTTGAFMFFNKPFDVEDIKLLIEDFSWGRYNKRNVTAV